jgi:acetyl esterase
MLVVPGVDFARDLERITRAGRDHPMLTAADLADIARLYLGGQQGDRFPPSPLHAATLAGMPPTLIAVAGHDPLQEEGLAYAARLRADGVDVEVLAFADMFHPFFGFFAASAGARAASDAVCAAFARLLRATTSPIQKETR